MARLNDNDNEMQALLDAATSKADADYESQSDGKRALDPLTGQAIGGLFDGLFGNDTNILNQNNNIPNTMGSNQAYDDAGHIVPPIGNSVPTYDTENEADTPIPELTDNDFFDDADVAPNQDTSNNQSLERIDTPVTVTTPITEESPISELSDSQTYRKEATVFTPDEEDEEDFDEAPTPRPSNNTFGRNVYTTEDVDETSQPNPRQANRAFNNTSAGTSSEQSIQDPDDYIRSIVEQDENIKQLLYDVQHDTSKRRETMARANSRFDAQGASKATSSYTNNGDNSIVTSVPEIIRSHMSAECIYFSSSGDSSLTKVPFWKKVVPKSIAKKFEHDDLVSELVSKVIDECEDKGITVSRKHVLENITAIEFAETYVSAVFESIRLGIKITIPNAREFYGTFNLDSFLSKLTTVRQMKFSRGVFDKHYSEMTSTLIHEWFARLKYLQAIFIDTTRYAGSGDSYTDLMTIALGQKEKATKAAEVQAKFQEKLKPRVKGGKYEKKAKEKDKSGIPVLGHIVGGFVGLTKLALKLTGNYGY